MDSDNSLPPTLPIPSDPIEQTRANIRLLAIFHYVVGGLVALFALFPIFHLAMGLFLLFWDIPDIPDDPELGDIDEVFPVRMMGGMFTGVAALIILIGEAFAVCIIIAGRRLVQYRSHTYCLVIAGLLCSVMPFGTALGVFTIIVLIKPEAKALFKPSA